MLAEMFTIFILVCVFIFTVLLLYSYPTKNTHPLVYFFVFIGWFNSFVIVTLLPYDVYTSTGGSGVDSILRISWIFLYWSIYANSWLILPIMSNYYSSGEFSFVAKVKDSIYQEIKFYIVFCIALGGFLIYLYIINALTLASVPEVLVLLSNLWGLVLIILLLGHGLISIPISLWKQGNLETYQETLYMKAAQIDTNKKKNIHDLQECYMKIQEASVLVYNDPYISNLCDQLLSLFPKNYKCSLQVQSVKTEPPKYKDIVLIHKKLKYLLCEIERNHW